MKKKSKLNKFFCFVFWGVFLFVFIFVLFLLFQLWGFWIGWDKDGVCFIFFLFSTTFGFNIGRAKGVLG